MDLNDIQSYMDDLQKKLEKQTEDLMSGFSFHTDTDHSFQQQETSDHTFLEALKEDDRMEDEVKSKISTFKQLYDISYLNQTGRPMVEYGMEDSLDFSALIALLAAAVEIELNHTIYPVLRMKYGVRPEAKPANFKIRIHNLDINLGDNRQMLGPMIVLLKENLDILTNYIRSVPDFIEGLEQLQKVRNDAVHSMEIGPQRFISFYPVYSRLFNEDIIGLLDLKLKPRNLFAMYDSYSAEDDPYIQSLRSQQGKAGRSAGRSGVIFTDIRRLCMKFFNDACDGARLKVLEGLDRYIQGCAEMGIQYQLLDVSNSFYGYIMDGNEPERYLELLDDYCKQHSISAENPQALFIIGGQDVIPMLQFHNPTEMPLSYPSSEDLANRTLDTDLPYAFERQFTQTDSNRDLAILRLNETFFEPRFYVSRLPLEEGFLTSLEDDLFAYLNKALQAHKEQGIQISRPILTACSSARKVAAIMTRGIPLTPLQTEAGLVENDTFLSPLLRAEDKETVDKYMKTLSESDMLIFLLHGSPRPNSPDFYGDDRTSSEILEQPAAFCPQMLDSCSAKVFASISCFGAKFIGFNRNNSILLHAMHGDTLLFMGSSRSALGDFDPTLIDQRTGEERKESSCAIILMRKYLHAIMRGVPAGEALMQAKMEYFKWELESPKHDSIPAFSLTIQEFNLFGDPLLQLYPMPIGNEEILDNSIPGESIPYAKPGLGENIKYECLHEAASAQQSIRGSVSQLVDSNLAWIHKNLCEPLYQMYGLPVRNLHTVFRYTDAAGEEEIIVNYRNEDGKVPTDTRVHMDKHGHVLKLYSTL